MHQWEKLDTETLQYTPVYWKMVVAFVIRIKLNCILNSWSRDFTRHSAVALALTNLCWIIVSVSRAIDPTWQEAAQDSQRAPLCAMKYLCCAFIITYRPIRHRLWHETVLGSRGRDVWLRMLPVGRSSGAPGQPLLHKSQTRTSMKSSVFNKECVALSAPMGKPFVAPGCVVGFNVISMQAVLQALVRLCRLTHAASGLVGKQKQPFIEGGLWHQKWWSSTFQMWRFTWFYFPRGPMPSGVLWGFPPTSVLR